MAALNLLQFVLRLLAGDPVFEGQVPSLPQNQARRRRVRAILRHLFGDRVVTSGYSGYREMGEQYYLLSRANWGLPPERGVYLHVVNDDMGEDPAAYVREFSKIDGEVCFSLPADYVFKKRSKFFGILMLGTPEKMFGVDAWSHVDEFTGRRVDDDDGREGSARYEAWMIPEKSQLIGVVTSDKILAAKCRSQGIWVVEISTIQSLLPGTIEQAWEEASSWAKAHKLPRPMKEDWERWFDVAAQLGHKDY